MTTPHKNAPRALYRHLTEGYKPVAGVDYRKDLAGPGGNIPKENKVNAFAAGDRRDEIIEWWQWRVAKELTEIGVHGTEFGSATYDTTHLVAHQFMQAQPSIPESLRRDLRTLIDWWYWVYDLCSSPDRSLVDPERLTRGATCNPPGQRMIYHNGKPTRSVVNRTNVSWVWDVLAGAPYTVKRPGPLKPSTAGAEIDCLCLEVMAKKGMLYRPPLATKGRLEQVRLAMPFTWHSGATEWKAKAIKPYAKNGNNGVVEYTEGRVWMSLQREWASMVVGTSSGPVTSPPPEQPAPPDTPSGNVIISHETLNVRIEQARRALGIGPDGHDDPLAGKVAKVLEGQLAAMERWAK